MNSRQASAAGGQDHQQYGAVSGVLPLWDLSKKPRDNQDILNKLGIGPKVRGGALVPDIESKSKDPSFRWADGLTNKRLVPSIYPFDPDNWVLRLFESATDGARRTYGTWQSRLIVDHTNDHREKGCRSTQVIDSEDAQQYAWLSDLLSVTEPSGTTDTVDEEIWYDDAGYLAMLYDKLETLGRESRGTLALNIHRNLGHVTDGRAVGQLSHVFCFPRAGSGGTATPGGGRSSVGTTVVSSSSTSTPGQGSGRATSAQELMLRPDVKWDWSIGAGYIDPSPLEPGANGSEDDEPRKVTLILGSEMTVDHGRDTADSGQSNHARVPKTIPAKKLEGIVNVPKSGSGGCCHYDDSYHSPPPEEDYGSGGSTGSDVAADSGASPPDSDGMNPDGSSPTTTPSDPYDPNADPTPTTDSRSGFFSVQGCDHGHAPAQSPRYSQRFNVHLPSGADYVVGSAQRIKPQGYTTIRVVVLLRISRAIPAGKEIELEVMLGVYGDGTGGPSAMYSQSIRFGESTSTATWIERHLVFRGWTPDRRQVTCLLIRRNDIATNATTVELWRARTEIIAEA